MVPQGKASVGMSLPDGSRADYSDTVALDMQKFPRARVLVNLAAAVLGELTHEESRALLLKR